jgi:hypothetical protein
MGAVVFWRFGLALEARWGLVAIDHIAKDDAMIGAAHDHPFACDIQIQRSPTLTQDHFFQRHVNNPENMF